MNGRKEKLSREIEFISKSQRKRDAQLVKSLASELIRLSSSQLAQVPLEATVREAVQEARDQKSTRRASECWTNANSTSVDAG